MTPPVNCAALTPVVLFICPLLTDVVYSSVTFIPPEIRLPESERDTTDPETEHEEISRTRPSSLRINRPGLQDGFRFPS